MFREKAANATACRWAYLALAAGALGIAVMAQAADDTVRMYGAWEITFPYLGKALTLVSVHDSSGYKNYVLLSGACPSDKAHSRRRPDDGPRRPPSRMILAHTSSLTATHFPRRIRRDRR
jgi:hypothetical protein